LVARAAVPGQAIVAAADLARRDVPVLRKAGALSLSLGAPLIVVHNINPASSYVSSGMGAPIVCFTGEALIETRRSYLLDAARALSLQLEPVVSIERDAVDAILTTARARNADLIVVGTNPRFWVVRLLTDGIAAALVDRANRSVLVVPLGTKRAPRAAQLALS
jgi:nucleotide-binding universal stress UspA family protein